MMTEAKRRTSPGRRVGAALAALLAAATASTLITPAVANAVVPQEDPFYLPPPDFAATAPGTILRTRPVKLKLPVPVQSWQLLYRTTDLFDQPDVTVTTVILPENVRPDRPLLAQQFFEDASGPTCVPSYGLQVDAPLEPSLAGQLQDLMRGLGDGWVVTVPDFEGRFGHLGAAKEPGYMTLDGVRAAENFAPLGLNPNTKVGMYGYSGGGIATGWTAEMQPGYAPELNIVGIALGAPAPDLVPAVLRSNGGPFAGLVGSGMAALNDAYPELRAALDPHLTAEGAAQLHSIRSQCLTEIAARYAMTNWDRYLDVPLDQVLADPPIKAVLDRTRLGTTAPTAPMYIYQGLADEVVPSFTTDTLVEKYCAAGTSVHYVHDPTATHVTSGLKDASASYDWLRQRLDTPAVTGCTTQTL